MQPMNEVPFETVLGERVEAILDACTRCGKCVEVCPSVEPAGISDTESEDIIGGILELVRSGNGPEASHKWAQSCMQSGECIKACATASIRASCLPWKRENLRRRTRGGRAKPRYCS